MGEVQDVLERCVPALVRQRLIGDVAKGAWAEATNGAVLFADITGSTALAERLAERGPAGAEALSRILNTFFGVLIEVIDAHGGDVIKFAGDGLFAFWRSDAVVGRGVATRRAARCGVAAQAALVGVNLGEDTRLSMRIGIGCGDVTAMALGAPGERLDFVMVGAPVAQACDAEREAHPGDVVASPEAWTMIAPHCTGTPLPNGAVRLEQMAGGDVLAAEVRAGRGVADAAAPTTTRAAPAALRHFAPPALLARLAAGHSNWLAEMRSITALFVQLPDWSNTELGAAQDMLGVIHAGLDHYQGSLVRLGMDVGGPVVKAAFGLPPQAHEDDGWRAVQAALEIRDGLAARGIPIAIGIATGRSFCGEVGNDRRSEYTTVGEVVHRSARLMQGSDGDILCDAATRDACARHFDFTALEPLSFKGLSGPVAVFRPRDRARHDAAPARSIIGRAQETARLRQCLDDLAAGGGAEVMVVEGDAGLGKSHLVQDLVEEASARGIRALLGAGEAIETSTAHHAWRPILAQLLEIDPSLDAGARQVRLRESMQRFAAEQVAGAPLPSLAPLLNPILGTDLADSEATAAITGEARADTTNELVVRLLESSARERPLFTIFEDAHWLDSASWAVLELMAVRVRPLLVVIATRPLQEPLPPAYRRLLQAPDTEKMSLPLLDEAETAQLVAARLGVRMVSEQVVAFIRERAGGHPFFTEELTRALRESGVVRVSGDEGRVAPEAGDLRSLTLPLTVEATLTGRMDALEARQQLVLKVASVFGRTFSSRALLDVYPLAADRPHLDDDLALLGDRDLVHRYPTEGPQSYTFKHAITRDVAYDRMAFAQRRQLHRIVAEWYERTSAADVNADAPLLAHHWSQAADPHDPEPAIVARAIDALERAGEQAVASRANAEAERFFSEALRFQDVLGDGDDSTTRRRVRWHRHLAVAKHRLGKIPQAVDHALRALAYLGRPFPQGAARQQAGIAVELGRQMKHRISRRGLGSLTGRAREDALAAANLYELLGLMWYVTLDNVPSMLANLSALNLAELAGPSPELATSSAMVGLIVGVLLGTSYGEHYFSQGLAAAQSVGDRYGYGRVCYNRGLAYTGEARWAEVYAAYDEALASFREIGEARWREMSMSMIASTAWLRRRYAEARRSYETVSMGFRERGDVQGQAWNSVGIAIALVAEGRSAEGLEAFDRCDEWLARNFEHLADGGTQAIIYAMRAVAHLRLGRPHEALAAIEENLRLLRESAALTSYSLGGYTYAAEACLRLWEEGDVPRARIEPLAKQAMGNLKRFARMFRLARPSLSLWSGVWLSLQGKQRRALAAWEATIPLAHGQDMPQEEGLAHYEIGRQLAAGDAQRRGHLERACEIFSMAEMAYELEQAQRALAGAAPRPT